MSDLFKYLAKSWKRDPIKSFIWAFVLSSHLYISFLIWGHSPRISLNSHKQLKVATFSAKSFSKEKQAAPSTLTTQATKKPSISPPKKPSPNVQSSKPKPTSAPVKKTTPKSKSTPAKKTAPPPLVPSSLLKEIEETIAKIETKSDKGSVKSDLHVPKMIEASSVKGSNSPVTIPFEEEDISSILVGYLQDHLQLPDFGEVKILLVVRANGEIEQIKVVASESEKNKKYLEQTLPKLTLPLLLMKKTDLNKQTFLLTFCNEL